MIPACTSCGNQLRAEDLTPEGEVPCPWCRTRLLVAVFPALARSPATEAPRLPSAEGEATCFYHHRNRAALPCDGCGRFLCSLCDLEIGLRHLCPECVRNDAQPGRPGLLTTERTRWDRLALSLAVLPALTIYFTLLTAPMAIYLSVRHWRSPGGLMEPGRWRFVAAILISSAQIAGWAGIVYLIAHAPRPVAP